LHRGGLPVWEDRWLHQWPPFCHIFLFRAIPDASPRAAPLSLLTSTQHRLPIVFAAGLFPYFFRAAGGPIFFFLTGPIAPSFLASMASARAVFVGLISRAGLRSVFQSDRDTFP
jgi:hypothetical protein